MFQTFFILLFLFSFSVCQYQLIFDNKFSPPPIIPLESKDYFYSVPLNQMMSKPIIIYVQFSNGSRITKGPLSSENYEVSSIDVKTAYSKRNPDLWADSGGKLCQRAAWWVDLPQSLDRSIHKVRCGSNISDTTLIVQAFKGKIVIDWIYHKHTVLPINKRVLRVRLRRKSLKSDSYAFKITAPAHHLEITQEPPPSVIANHDFVVKAEIKHENGSIITEGLDSVAFVEICIPYYYKKFFNDNKSKGILKSTPFRLGGKDATINQGNKDLIIRKQAVRGVVVFNRIRILDPGKGLKLNLTLLMIRDPWSRVPNCANCYTDIEKTIISKDGREVTFPEPDSYLMNELLGIKLTRPFDVQEQTLHKLIFSDFTRNFFRKNIGRTTGTLQVTRNIMIPGKISVAAVDSLQRRIYAGGGSAFKLIYKTIPTSVCITTDSTREVTGGFANLELAVCQIIKNVTIEIVPNFKPTASIFTPALSVDGILNVAHFGDFRYSGDGANVQVHINSFIRFAAIDLNKGFMIPSLAKQGFNFKVQTFETKSRRIDAYQALLKMEDVPMSNQRVKLIITSTTGDIVKSISPELPYLGALLISTSNTESAFSDKSKYPLFNRLCWSDMETYKSVIIACKDRMWKKIIIVKEKNIHIEEEYLHMSHESGVDIMGVVEIDGSSIIPGEISFFKYEMGIIKSFGTKIIILIANKRIQPYILRAAQLTNLDSLHGYQWILYSSSAWQFPFTNGAVCKTGVPCTKAFAATYLFSESFNISGYRTKDWVRILGYHFSVDRFHFKGGRVKYRPPEVGAKMALGYDSLILYAYAVEKIISRREIIEAHKVAILSRRNPFKGLTGTIFLNEHGDREGFFGFIAQVNPMDIEKVIQPISHVVTFTRILTKNQDGTQLEIPYKAWRPGTDPDDPQSYAVVPTSSKYNTRTFTSVSGLVDQLTQAVSENPSEPWPSIKYTRKEEVVPIYTCDHDCGKNVLSPEDVNVYDTGRCDKGGQCVCNEGFHGNFCKQITCKCDYGTCISVSHCSCFHGWRGLECNKAICHKCISGTCVKPDVCECTSGLYIGEHCSLHIATILIPLILGSALCVVVTILIVRYIMKHAKRNAALSNTDWIVEWPYVTNFMTPDTTISKTSIGERSSLISQKDVNTYIWKNEKWYGKAIPSRTIDPNIAEMRLEMVELLKIRHRNLIIYGGACLTSPNVCLFIEVADKGSLNDVLLNESIDIGWEFKFSFMKDICAGMKFLQEKTNIITHGRLKSRNCLIDSRWTIRISDFGAYTIRFGRFRLEPDTNEGLKQFFWTAPELLDHVTCIDDVKNGTISGDTYSFSIVIAEILTRAEPYSYEMEYISEKAIYDMITDTDSRDRKEAHKIWDELGGASMFSCRPILRDEFLPESSLQKKQLVKMLEDAWNDNPSGRPNFDKLATNLNQIHPVKGELIDNLIKLLESYSTNLEMIVIERTKELEVNKARAEQLLSQMLPKKVTAELKIGKKVPPEIFPTATVFFSDIVDFGKICQDSTPFQIVDFLNETYNAFDDVLDSYDVYKVETISDSYMVVSGVPECNGIKHASEIATMALDLMSTVTTFVIPHRPKATLQLRIGMNSGPVVAGVVGMLMPRYCLFGDTVNTASRMESSSQALCIQVSESTAKILDEIGGFDLESRGQREVKGRGLMTTYWLWGKEDFNKPMPDQSLALSLSQHKFK